MAYRPPRRPYEPLRGQPPSRGGIPRAALIALAVVPALLVIAFVFWRSGDTPTTAEAVTTSPRADIESEARATASTRPDTQPAAQPTAASAPAPASLSIAAPELTAAAAIVVDDASMEVLYDLNAYAPRPPASVTKMATAVVVMEHARLDEEVTSTVHYWDLAAEGDATTMGLTPGDVLTVRELLYGLLLVSGNDAAQVLAQHIAGSEEAFVDEMNALAERLGMTSTHFENADGLSAPGHVSSPWDLVLLSRYLMRFPDLREIVGTEEYTAHGLRDGADVTFDLYNHNPLLNYTPGVDGIKTGFTEEAGRTFAVTVERDGHRVYIVLMDTVLRAQDAQALIEWTYENFRWPGDTPLEASEASDTPVTSP